ncbi:hypothetical protein [Lacicoccus alkaliphilus]|uniref:Acetyltransferase (GNAT) domain-containing protein n=1 Tax=Lacicoccus alkaliphilus DSM 16010 TaxID=1123231 RepID=A0A1M7ASU6_9BACL|nr:hypothetical protein [Salinicoccus alkaliphilus]SHL45850.1 hypothetical protein SAMN02745189_00245 [Salinicoccus alkaliphilus DSM 16010]
MEITLHKDIAAHLQDKNMIPNYPASGHGVICEAEDEILSYLYYSLNPYHPSTLYLRFAVLDKSIKPETVVDMYEKLKSTLPLSDIILEVHCRHGLYEKLIDEHGFEKFRETYELEVDITEMFSHFDGDEAGGEVTEKNFEMTGELLDISKKVYESVHQLIPLREMSLAGWEGLITDELDFKNSIVIYDETGKITAYMLMYENDEASVDVGYCYYADTEAKQSLISTFKDTLLHLLEKDFEQINLEVDTTDGYAYEFFKSIVADEQPVLVSYISRQPQV